MIKLIAGKYGPRLLGPGTVLNLDEAEEERLVKRKVAVYIGNDESTDGDGNDKDELKILTVDQLNKFKSKKELIKYAESVGLHDLQEADKKESLVDAIANYLEENFDKE